MSGDNPSRAKWGLPVAIVLAGMVLAGVIYLNLGNGGKTNQKTDETKEPEVAGVTTYKVEQAVPVSDSDITVGNADAPVTVIMFADFECPYCREWFRNSLPMLKSEFVDTGQVKLVFKNFPLSDIHPRAQEAALAAYCASDQGKFMELAQRVYALDEITDDTWDNLAAQIGLAVDNFDQCRGSEETAWRVAGNAHDAVSMGVTATPTFIIGDTVYVGVLPYDTLKGEILNYE